MNERIKQLALKSKLLVEKPPSFSKGMEELHERLKAATDAKLQFYYGIMGGKPESQEVLVQKFAQLILLEVTDILSTYRGKMVFVDGAEYNYEHPIIAIKKHFGV
jgi:hypothetical protein